MAVSSRGIYTYIAASQLHMEPIFISEMYVTFEEHIFAAICMAIAW